MTSIPLPSLFDTESLRPTDVDSVNSQLIVEMMDKVIKFLQILYSVNWSVCKSFGSFTRTTGKSAKQELRQIKYRVRERKRNKLQRVCVEKEEGKHQGNNVHFSCKRIVYFIYPVTSVSY